MHTAVYVRWSSLFTFSFVFLLLLFYVNISFSLPFLFYFNHIFLIPSHCPVLPVPRQTCYWKETLPTLLHFNYSIFTLYLTIFSISVQSGFGGGFPNLFSNMPKFGGFDTTTEKRFVLSTRLPDIFKSANVKEAPSTYQSQRPTKEMLFKKSIFKGRLLILK